MKKFLLIAVLATFLFSCKKEVETLDIESNYGYNYFPMEIGSYITYKGDSIIYNYFYTQVKRTRSFYLKEVVSDTSRDNLNRLAYDIDVYERFDTNQAWQHLVKWYKVTDNKFAERIEDNLRYIKLIFPQKVGTHWNPYRFIQTKIPYIFEIDSSLTIIDSRAVILNKDVPYTNAFLTFDSTLTVSNLIDSSSVDYYKITEKYARNIGMVYREQWNVIAKDAGRNPSLPWIDRARLGFYIKLEAINYGKE